jgi:hypothetical protein
MTEVVAEHQESFEAPKREVFNIFDINKWYKSEVSMNF